MAEQGKRGPPRRSEAGWRQERERSAATQAAKSRAGRDITATFPAVADAARKEACRLSLALFCRTYLPDTFDLPWSDDHLRAIGRIEQAVREGGLFAYAMPRGSGKTSLAEAATLWATLYGYRQFVVIIGSDEGAANEILESIKGELECNELLLADFPEVCWPIRCLEGIAHRAHGQTVARTYACEACASEWPAFGGDGRVNTACPDCGEAGGPAETQRTHVGWCEGDVVYPTLPASAGSKASGAVIRVTGITGRIRGMKFKRPDGKSVRPDLVIPDDPQTDVSAKSPSQCDERLRILCGAVLGLAGPGKKIAGVMPCTVIRPGDMVDQVLDRQRHPEWQGERTKLVYAWPEDLDAAAAALWQQYREIRADGLRNGDGGSEATAFYERHRAAMDAGGRVAWEARKSPGELSALQHAVNLRQDRGEAAFSAEYQNEPADDHAADADADALTAQQVAEQLNRRPRGVVPRAATKLVAFIDVQKTVLVWGVVAFEDDFTGYVVDYGAWPEQPTRHYHRRDVTRTLARVLKAKSLEEALYQGLQRLTEELLGREWPRRDPDEAGADAGVARVDRCLVDASWGDSNPVVLKFCRESKHASVLVPSHGRYVGATSRELNEPKPKPGEERGDHWRRPPAAGRRAVRHVLFDSNYWKGFLHARLAVPLGGPGCLSLYGDDPEAHRMLAEHVTAERPVPVESKGRRVTEFKLPPSKPDNDLLDVLTGCCVAASMQRVALAERGTGGRPPPRRVKRIKLSELQKQKAQQRHGRATTA